MSLIAVLENNGEHFADIVLPALADAGDVCSGGGTEQQGCARYDNYDLIILSPSYSGGAGGSCSALVIPDGACPAAAYFTAERVVTYGMSPRSTLTLSSLPTSSGGGGRALLAVQRELTASSGAVIEEQELAVTMPGGIDATLASAGGRLLLGLTDAGVS
ncbi:MAG: hypothetical protein LBH17_08235 [Oscillospiraceae bacterium]|nr:hypothetical protein [Oscillospiraceae bacterium]